MRKSARLFEIIQILRNSDTPLTAQHLAAELEVSTRTIYRDIQALQMMRTPIDGEAGVGYVLHKSYDLPAINFTINELEAIWVGLSLLARIGDRSLQRAAKSVTHKINFAKNNFANLIVSDWGVELATEIDLEEIRNAIRTKQKIDIDYVDESNSSTQRIIVPIAIIYYIEVVVIAAWCELRQDIRHFRIDRIKHLALTDSYFTKASGKLDEKWQLYKER